MPFDKNVFVNCPFDQDYRRLLQPLLFTLIYLGFKPRIALEESDSGIPRIQKILRLIGESRLSIHDLSRLRATQAGEFYRMNMPFELGLDVGCRTFEGRAMRKKRCLILESEPYRFQAAISDISNSDIAAHHDVPKRVSSEVRNWLASQSFKSLPGPAHVWSEFLFFEINNRENLRLRGFSDRDTDKLPIGEIIRLMEGWTAARRAIAARNHAKKVGSTASRRTSESAD